MAKPILDRPRIVPCIGQGVAAAVTEHVAMHREIEASTLANAFDVPINRVRREWSAAFGREHKAESGNCRRSSRNALNLVAAERMNADGLPFLTRRTCSAADRPNSTCDHSRSQISEARRPCRNAIRIKVASR